MAKNRCPNCGKRVPDGVLACPRCGHSIPIAYSDAAHGDAVHAHGDEWDTPFTDGDDDIEDPEVLEQVEEYVKGLSDLPYTGRARSYQTACSDPDDQADKHAPVRPNDPRDVPGPDARDDSAPAAGECPVCGRQAPKGWDKCLWCGTRLGPEVWAVKAPETDIDRPDGASDAGIFDPELLEQAEACVKALPDVLYRGRDRRQVLSHVKSADRHDRLAHPLDEERENAAVEEDEQLEEDELVGSECPACGRQAQPGWTKCPWCGTALSFDDAGSAN